LPKDLLFNFQGSKDEKKIGAVEGEKKVGLGSLRVAIASARFGAGILGCPAGLSLFATLQHCKQIGII
jgi:hypothetical protein